MKETKKMKNSSLFHEKYYLKWGLGVQGDASALPAVIKMCNPYASLYTFIVPIFVPVQWLYQWLYRYTAGMVQSQNVQP